MPFCTSAGKCLSALPETASLPKISIAFAMAAILEMPRLPTVLSGHNDAIEFLPLDSTAFQRPIGIVQRASHPRSSLELAFLRQLRRAVQPAGGAG